MAEDTFGQITGRVVHAKTKTWEDGSRSLRVLVRSNDDKRTVGLSFGGDAFEPALAAFIARLDDAKERLRALGVSR